MDRRTKRGFTIVELLVALGIAAILLSLTYQIFVSQRRGYTVQEDVAEMQQNARIAADELARLIKNIGNGVDLDNNQPQLLYAGPYELVFSGDLDLSSTTVPGANGVAVDSLHEPGVGTLVTVANPGFAGNAETYQVALVEESAGSRHYTLVRRTLAGNAWTDPEEIARNLNLEDAAGSEVFLFRYWGDFDLDGTEEWWDVANGSDPVAAPTGRTLEEVVRRVEIAVVAETRRPDPRYSDNAGHRQAVVRSNVTPRNLWNCPRIDPENPVLAVTTATVAGQELSYRFQVTEQGVPVPPGRAVQFALAVPVGDTQTALVSAVGMTGADGWVTARVRWAPCATFAALISPAAGSANYLLTATLPASTTPLGFPCEPESADTQITVGWGPAALILAGPTFPSDINTCESPDSFTFAARAFDACGVERDPDPFSFVTLDRDDQPFPQYQITPPVFTTTGEMFTVERVGTNFTAPREITGEFLLRVGDDPAAWMTGGVNEGIPSSITATPPGWPLEVRVWPWPPNSLGDLTTAIQDLVNHRDCRAETLNDTFGVFDCAGHAIWNYQWVPPSASTAGYAVVPTLLPALPPPADQGTVAVPGSTGGHSVSYTTPVCTLGPPPGRVINPQFRLDLTDGATVLDSLGPVPLNLESCADCEIAATPETMTLCEGSTLVEMWGCDLDRTWARLRVTSSGGATRNGSFSPTDPAQDTVLVELTGAPSSKASARLYVGNARLGDTLTITAEYLGADPSGPVIWSCASSKEVAVSNACEDLQIFSDAGYSRRVGNDVGQESCLARLHSLYFEVEDCQYRPGTLPRAVVVYAISDGGNYVDRELVDLSDHATPIGALPTRFRSVNPLPVEAADTPLWGNGILTYPRGKVVRLVAAYKDPYDSGDDQDPNYGATVSLPLPLLSGKCQEQATLAVPLPLCFPNAVTSGGGGGWSGNFEVHWGDVVIRGNAKLAPSPKFIRKRIGGQYNGQKYLGGDDSDRFLDVYVGRSWGDDPFAPVTGNFLDNSSAPVSQTTPPGVLDRPFLPAGLGSSFSKGAEYGNYFRNISYDKITAMMNELDYDQMKALAKERGVYWYTLPGGNIRNPDTGLQASLQQVLHQPGGPGVPNAYRTDLNYIFVDTEGTADPGPATTGSDIDTTAVLPIHAISGNFFAEGIIYITGTLSYDGGGGERTIRAQAPPRFESHYDHSNPAWAVTEDLLPIRPNPSAVPDTFDLGVNINGALYLEGEFAGSGSPSIFGAVSAKRGYTGSGTPQIWYNYKLNTGENLDLCISCCTLEVSPQAAVLDIGSAATVSAFGAAGSVTWSSDDATIASVTPGGTITGRREGTTSIRATDENNCTARVAVRVRPPPCPLVVAPSTVTVAPGASVTLAAAGAAGAVAWSSNNPLVATVDPATGEITGVIDGVAIITAADPTCSATATVRVSSAPCTLAINPPMATIDLGGIPLDLFGEDATGILLWESDNPAVATVSPGSGPGTTVTARSLGTATVVASDAGCTTTSVITVVQPECSLTVSPDSGTVLIGGPDLQLSAAGAYGVVTWTSAVPSIASVGADGRVTGLKAGDAVIRATDPAAVVHATGAFCSVDVPVEVVCPLTFSDLFTAAALAPGWTSTQVGSPVPAGTATPSGGALSLAGSGASIGEASDQFHFLHRRNLNVTDDFVMTVKVVSVSTPPPGKGFGALMIRDTTAATSNFVAIAATPASAKDRLLYRTTSGFVRTGATANPAFPYYLRLSKEGSIYKAYVAPDPASFGEPYWQGNLPSPFLIGDIEVGLGVTAGKNGDLTTVVFDDFTLDCP